MPRPLVMWSAQQVASWLKYRKAPPASALDYDLLPPVKDVVLALKSAGVRPNGTRQYEARLVRAAFPAPKRGRPPRGAYISTEFALVPHVQPTWSIRTIEDFGVPDGAEPHGTDRRRHFSAFDVLRLAQLLWENEPMHLGDLHTLYLRGKRLLRPGWSAGFPELYQRALVLLDHYPLQSYFDQELDEDQGTSLPEQRVRAGEWRRAEWVLKRNDEVRPLIKLRYR